MSNNLLIITLKMVGIRISEMSNLKNNYWIYDNYSTILTQS